MADWFVDTGLATGSNNGTSMDNAWQSLKTAMEYASFAAGDKIWVRRRSSYTATSSITPTADGAESALISWIGWPRNTHTISSSDWTNGSNTVTVDDNDMVREKHQARYITAPDGFVYLITRVVNTGSIMIDRPYPGSTVSNASATIHADDDYSTAQAIDDSAWTIKKTDWNGDSDALHKFDFSGTSYGFAGASANSWILKNLDIVSGTGWGTYAVTWPSAVGPVFEGIMLKQPANDYATCWRFCTIRRFTMEGTGSGTSQRGFYTFTTCLLEDGAIYNFGDTGIYQMHGFLRNVNVGVEQANGDFDISHATSIMKGIDVKCGGTNGDVVSNTGMFSYFYVENYGKVLGAHKFWNWDGRRYYTNVAVVAGSGDPYKRTGGADQVLKATPVSVSSTYNGISDPTKKPIILEYTFSVDTTQRTYRIYVQAALMSLTASQLVLEADYADSYAEASEYHLGLVRSDEAISTRSGADDWSQYVEVTVQPAVASNVHLRLRGDWIDSDGILYIDPLVEIS